MITIVPLFSNSKNNSPKSAFYTALYIIENIECDKLVLIRTTLTQMIVFCLLKYEMTP